MSKVCSYHDIKYTMVIVNDDELQYASEMVYNYLTDVVDTNTLDIPRMSNGILGFVADGKFWNPVLEPDGLENHWAIPIAEDYKETLVVLKGAPNSYEVTNAMKDITGDESYIITGYDSWRLDNENSQRPDVPADFVAVVVEST